MIHEYIQIWPWKNPFRSCLSSVWSQISKHSLENNSSTGLQKPRMGRDWMCVHRDCGGTSTRVHFFYIRVFNPYTPSNCKSTNQSVYRRHEREKRHCYERKNLEVEHGSFTPLVFSAVGGMGIAATVMYKRLASLLADTYAQSYSKTMSWIRCLLNFSLLRSSIMCVHGAHSTSGRVCRTTALGEGQLDLVASEDKIPNC